MARSRRDFLRTSAVVGGVLSLGPAASMGAMKTSDEPLAASKHPLRILILGGTGFIGPHQVEYALKRGHTVTLFNRGRTNPGLFPDVETLIGDRDGDLESLKDRTWDAVIDNSGYLPRHVRESAGLLKEQVGSYLFVSSISAYDPALIPEDDEYSAPLATMPDPTYEPDTVGEYYGALKALCEQETMLAFAGRGIVVRPGLIAGPGDRTDRIRHWVARVDRGGEILVPGRPDDRVQFIDARDLAGWCIRLVENEESGIYNCVGPESPLSIAELVYGFRAISNKPITFTWVDEVYLSGMLVSEFAYQPWQPSTSLYWAFNHINITRALAKGLTFRPLAETGFDMLEEYRNATEEQLDADFGRRSGVSWEREAEILAAWHARPPEVQDARE